MRAATCCFPLLILSLLAGLLAVRPAAAQGTAPEGPPTVGEVELAFEGPRSISNEAVLANIRVRPGQTYDQNAIDQSIRTLYETGLFDFIEARREPMEGEQVRVTFVIVPKYKVGNIAFEGNEEISDRRLEEEVESEEGLPLNEVQVKRDRDAIFEYYQEKGYTFADVEYGINRDEDTGVGDITFEIEEGRKLRISEIRFEGNETVDDDDLEDVMQTSEYFFLTSWLTGSGRFQEEKFADDLESLRQYYKERGYLDVEIGEDAVRFEYPAENKLEVVVSIAEGRQYSIGETAIEGNTLYTTEELRGAIDIEQGQVFSPSRIDAAAESLRDYYGREGYLDTFVRAERIPNMQTGDIDLVFRIRESDRFQVESITLIGNTKTKSKVIVRELALAPGDTFDLVRMKTSEARLRNTLFFEEVNLAPEPTNIPNRRNLRITVREARTGNLSFGAGFSSVEEAIIFAELTQSNFDLFNYRSLFQGDGQKFRLRLSLGTASNQVLLSFEEPWLFERELAFGFEIFRTETDFNSNVFDELRTGFEIYFRKRLFELVEGRLSYRLEDVEISDVDPTVSQEIQDEEGNRSVSKVGFSLLRDTRNSFLQPTEGTRMEALTEFAGGPLLGQTDYWNNTVRGGIWIPTFDFGNQVLQLVGRTGSIIPYDDGDVPFFDRYFLGGPNSLRGFDFREVGPKDNTGEPLGGNTFGFASLEYSYQVAQPVRVAVFYDWGFVNPNDLDWSPSDYNDNWGVGLRLLLLGAPLRLDLGFPITADDQNDDGAQFNFSFGTVF